MCLGIDKMKVLIITVAGMSSRFSQSIGKETIKCLYYEKTITESLLYTILSQSSLFDRFIIVGGYKYDELDITVRQQFLKFINKIIIVQNSHYADYGSGYSLYIGLKKALEIGATDIVFAEGDLYLDMDTYKTVCTSENSVITINREPILANKAVAFYFDISEKIHYIYDTGHKALMIKEPFLGIYNSGQVWKFGNLSIVKKVFDMMKYEEWKGTNLVFVEKYFQIVPKEEIRLCFFQRWINCNTVEDFRSIKEGI